MPGATIHEDKLLHEDFVRTLLSQQFGLKVCLFLCIANISS